MSLDPRTIPELARAGAERFTSQPAVERVSAGESAALSYVELWDSARRGAALLHAAGLVQGDCVLLALPGGPEWAAAFFAIAGAGSIAVPVAPGSPPAMVAAIAAHAGARACVVREKSDPLASAIQTLRLLVPDELASWPEHAAASLDPEDVVASLDFDDAMASLDPEASVLLCFTSGSTARPRAVALSHRNLLSNVRALLSVGQAQPGDSFLSMLPLSHIFELVCGFLAPLACGARIVYPGAPLPNRVIDALREQRITHALAVPALIEAFSREALSEFVASGAEGSRGTQPPREYAGRLRAARAPVENERIREGIRRRIGPRFHTLLVGGAALDPGWSELIEPLGIELQIGYGLTEAGPIVSGGLASTCPRGSVGRPLSGVAVRVDENGEILVRSPSVMRGYFKDPEATAAALAGGWLHTGDRGRLDENGFLFVTGRLKEVLVTSAGETLYPEDVEPYYESPLFAEHCVVPLPGHDGNDVPTLVVVPAAPETGEDDLERAVARLRAAAPARFRVAGFVRHEGPLPKTALGKVQRRALAETLRAREGTR